MLKHFIYALFVTLVFIGCTTETCPENTTLNNNGECECSVGYAGIGTDCSMVMCPDHAEGALNCVCASGYEGVLTWDGVVWEGSCDLVTLSSNWAASDFEWRLSVTLQAASHERQDVPVLIDLPQADTEGVFVHPNAQLYEKLGDEQSALSAHVWLSADKRFAQLGFTATGTTPAEATRDFILYYNTTGEPPETGWNADWASFNSAETFVGISANDNMGYELQRELTAGRPVSGRQSNGNTKINFQGESIAEGFQTNYQVSQCDAPIEPITSLETEAPPTILEESNDFSASLHFMYPDINNGQHETSLSYRFFNHTAWPFLSANLTVNEDFTNSQELAFARKDKFNPGTWDSMRSVYLTGQYNRMLSDSRGDEALPESQDDEPWDLSQRYLILYNDADTDQNAFGWFLFDAAPVRARVEDDNESVFIFDSYGYSAQVHDPYGAQSHKNNRLTYIWMAGDTQSIQDKFEDMLPGATAGTPEHQNIDFVQPQKDLIFIAGDNFNLEIRNPHQSPSVTANLVDPTGESVIPLTLTQTAEGWLLDSPRTFLPSDPLGTWHLSVTSGNFTRTRTFELASNPHPHLFFDANDLEALRLRKDNTDYATLWAGMLTVAEGFCPDCVTEGCAAYVDATYFSILTDKLANTALVQLMDESQNYLPRIKPCFWEIIEEADWDNFDTQQFSHHTLVLAQIYDWFYADFSAQEREEIRAQLLRIAKRQRSTSDFLKSYPLPLSDPATTWADRGHVLHNHYWNSHNALAALTFGFDGEVNACQQTTWEDHIEANFQTVLGHYFQDGSSQEGLAYYNYGMFGLFQWLEVMNRHWPESEIAEAVQAWLAQMVYFEIYGTTPGGDDNYGGTLPWSDTLHHHWSNPPKRNMAYIASFLNATDATETYATSSALAQWMAINSDRDYNDMLSYVWYDNTIESASSLQNLASSHLFDDTGIFVHRSSWENDATFFSAKSGTLFGGHDHPQQGDVFLFRDGLPYISPMPYSALKMTSHTNTLLVDNEGQHGEGETWTVAQSLDLQGQLEVSVAEGLYFDLLLDATNAYLSAKLDSWQREVIALDADTFLIHDIIHGNDSMELDLLLHSFKATPPADQKNIYDFADGRLENPWATYDANPVPHWSTRPHESVDDLYIYDVSADGWVSSIVESTYAPQTNYNTGASNISAMEEQQLGYVLNRSITTTQARSTLLLSFDAGLTVSSLSDGSTGNSGVSFNSAGGDVRQVVWSVEPTVSVELGTLTLQGEMGGRDLANKTYFARATTALNDGSTQLIAAQSAATVVASLEAPNPSLYAIIVTDESNIVTLYCPQEPATMQMDGETEGLHWSAGFLTVTTSAAGVHRVEATP